MPDAAPLRSSEAVIAVIAVAFDALVATALLCVSLSAGRQAAVAERLAMPRAFECGFVSFGDGRQHVNVNCCRVGLAARRRSRQVFLRHRSRRQAPTARAAWPSHQRSAPSRRKCPPAAVPLE